MKGLSVGSPGQKSSQEPTDPLLGSGSPRGTAAAGGPLVVAVGQGQSSPRHWRAKTVNALERLLDLLSDPTRRERAVLVVLACYAVLWTLYAVVAKGSQDLHFDFGEMYSWSLDTTWATPKHPPLAPWLVRAWFSLFPRTDWAYYLFAMVVATTALWFAWRFMPRYLDAEKRVVGLALLTFVPVFNFLALKFNNNAISLPTWAATTWLFLRAYETRRADWAALAGFAAGAAMLSKYWSVFLLAGLGVA